MRNKTIHFAAKVIGGLAAGVLLFGCSYQHGEDFTTSGNPSAERQFMHAQSVAGAKADATLYDRNFDGAELNSLGKNKIDLICQGSGTAGAVAIYLDMPHDRVGDRETSVSAYLKKSGVQDSRIKLAEGANPGQTTPSAYNLPSVYKTDGTTYNGQAADLDTSSGGGGAAASSAGK